MACNLLHHASAALQYASDADADCPMFPARMINQANAAPATLDESEISDVHSMLVMYNERGCPHNARRRPSLGD